MRLRPGPREGVVSFGEEFYLTTASPWQRCLRNVRLLAYLIFLVRTWLVIGGRIRRAHRAAQQTGQPFYLDELASGEIYGKHTD